MGGTSGALPCTGAGDKKLAAELYEQGVWSLQKGLGMDTSCPGGCMAGVALGLVGVMREG